MRRPFCMILVVVNQRMTVFVRKLKAILRPMVILNRKTYCYAAFSRKLNQSVDDLIGDTRRFPGGEGWGNSAKVPRPPIARQR